MNDAWSACKNILCIRADNMGDVLMSSPAIRALKQHTGAKITLLTSCMGSPIAGYLAHVDEVISINLPWVQSKEALASNTFLEVVNRLRGFNFDAAVIFSVYSQNILPSALLTFLANIPLRLAYCRENPYELLTHWVPDEEPYTLVKHQVQRDMDLISSIGVKAESDIIELTLPAQSAGTLREKLLQRKLNEKPWVVLHAGVSELKRQYPEHLWVEAAKGLISQTGYNIILTGSKFEKRLTQRLAAAIGNEAHAAGGLFSLSEFCTLVKQAPLVLSVNTGTIHVAAATKTPQVVLYAKTNPQHFPWKGRGKVLCFDVLPDLKSKNEVIRYVDKVWSKEVTPAVDPSLIVAHALDILKGNIKLIPQMPKEFLPEHLPPFQSREF